jgi:hypothetical protein
MRGVFMDDHKVTITLTFSAMAESPDDALRRCLAYLENPPPTASVLPISMTAKVDPK